MSLFFKKVLLKKGRPTLKYLYLMSFAKYQFNLKSLTMLDDIHTMYYFHIYNLFISVNTTVGLNWKSVQSQRLFVCLRLTEGREVLTVQ